MALVQSNEGDKKVIEELRSKWNTNGTRLKIHLLKATFTPSETLDPATLTEADYPGYAAQFAAVWTAASIVSSKGKTTADPLIFTHGAGAGSNDIYGYWAECEEDGKLMFAETFSSPITLASNGQTIVLYPAYTNNTE